MRDHWDHEGSGTGRQKATALPVLIADDEETIRILLGKIVARVGAEVAFAETVAQARAAIEERDFSCALIDKNLPDGNGLDLMAFLKERRPLAEAFLITGYANTESAIEALRLGAFDYLVKPFDLAAVTHRLRLAMERRQMREERERLVTELRRTNALLGESRQEIKRAYLETVLRLSIAAEFKDGDARAHVRRISRYCGILARAIDATEEWVENIVYAAPLHDIGKIGVPDAILQKPGPLTPKEREIMKEHVLIGARILEGTTSTVLSLAHEIILSHHERWDGTGYPKGLRGSEIPLSGRVVALADAWDAISTNRSYRRALELDQAVTELRRCAGTHFDETLVTAFLDSLPQVRAVLEEHRQGA
ncbi:MAG: response regulator [Deltaproteobacteria bacterium]|nr:response regulator [Deltaproteobacteria bacterium]